MSKSNPSRRDVVRTGATVTAAALTATLASRSHAASDEVLRVGLVGCGGRGTGAANQALTADAKAKLVAVGDLFKDHAEGAVRGLKAEKGEQVDVTAERVFVGFDAYKGVIDHCDVVLLATSPHYRPMHIEYAVEKGRHVFAEKPVATDAPTLRRCLDACRKAAEKNLTIVSGLCYRYERKKQALMEQVHNGALGEIVNAETYYLTGGLWHRGTKPDWTPMEYQNRNWLYFTWLSGDFIAEQHVHSLDKIAWAFNEYPSACVSSGGRAARTEERYGNVYDHFSTTFEYESGRTCYSACRQIPNTDPNVEDTIFGTEANATVQRHVIRSRKGGEAKWSAPRIEGDNMYQNEHDDMFAAIRAGTPINNGQYMCDSTMMAIMARMSAYTGKRVTWEAAWKSNESLAPAAYEWGPAPAVEVAIPGTTKFI